MFFSQAKQSDSFGNDFSLNDCSERRSRPPFSTDTALLNWISEYAVRFSTTPNSGASYLKFKPPTDHVDYISSFDSRRTTAAAESCENGTGAS